MATAASLSLPACGGKGGDLPPPEEGNAYLTIVGDRNVFIDHGAQQRLSIRYHDSGDQPLAGEIRFEVVGDARGSSLSKTSGVTNSQGIVELRLTGGREDASFRIKASAEYATAAEWTIAVQEGDSVPPLEPQGTYRLDSRFDVSTLPGDVGDVVNNFVAMTDDPYDPATWLLDEIDEVPGFLRPALDAILNEAMNEYAPDFVQDALAVGNKLGQAAKKFGTVTELEVTRSGDVDDSDTPLHAVHTMTGFAFRIDGQAYSFTIDELGSEEPEVQNIELEMDGDRMKVGAHDMPIRYGGFLGLALEGAVIPLIDPNATSLHEFFQNEVNCYEVGWDLYFEVGFFSQSFWEGACEIGLQAAAESIMAEIVDLDEQAPLLLKISGDARAADKDGDRMVDDLTSGKWSGAIDYDGEMKDLTEPGSFTGQRMNQ